MKNLSLHTLGSVVLLTIVSTIVVTLYARNPVPGKSTHLSRRAVARAEQSRRDSLNRLEALAALDENRWAFVSEELSGRKGPPLRSTVSIRVAALRGSTAPVFMRWDRSPPDD